MRLRSVVLFVGLMAMVACQEKDLDLASAENSFVIAKKPYTQGNYEIALNKLGEFKTRFPYSSFAIEAELLVAHAYFELGRYAEAVVSYEQFIKLHPKHDQVDFAQYRIGLAYWEQAPKEIDREQDLTSKGVAEWEKLTKNYPKSQYAAEAKELSSRGRRRIAESHEFIAGFYCRQGIWHACARRYLALAETYNNVFNDLVKKSLNEAAFALDKLAKHKPDKDEKADANLYFKAMTPEELQRRAEQLREQAKKL